ncbi:Proton-dependent oligopeptide transporter family [Corchorus olitorius]|uniref:Proton-dependent oligopeptide transporter family n=1 Tax=Corchorus olitorius TaxID=93759 RepID=A0A1R3JRP1_9ROSI|nr:Proton-dependent oligopeptide transporter family [Corchorus olitorius]
MIPICLSFIICGLVSSIGHTYFISQANHLNRTDHGKHYPLLLLTVFCEYYKSEYTRTYLSCAKNSSGKLRKFGPPIGIGISMVFAIFCCVTAAKVENQRLDLVKSHGLIDKPDEEIPMSFFKLTPQFALLGVLDGIFQASVAGFFKSQAPPSLAPYMTRLSEGIRGVGIIGSVLSVFVIGKISERGGKQPSWFQDTLNKSRLDNYYWTLTVMVSVNLVFYILMAFRFDYKDPTEVSDSEQSSDSGQSIGFEETRQELAFQDP